MYDSTATTPTYTTFSTIGIIQHSYEVQSDSYTFLQFLSSSSGPAILKNVATDDPTLQTWESYISTITALLTRHQTQTLDLMACALYSDPNWKYVIDELQTRLAVNIRASLDNTGYSSMGGNWILESDSANLKDDYFTDAIDGWKYLLATITDTRFYTMQFNNSMYLTYPGSSTAVNVGTGDFTFETWYYETSKQTGCTIFDKGNYNYTWQLRNANGSDGLSFISNGSNWLYANTAVVPVAQWSHVALTRSGTTFKFYINGTLMQTMTGPATLNNNGSNFSIGLQSPDNCFCNKLKTGTRLYDARMWNVCRTDSEIRMNRNRILPANTTGLVANYALTFPTSTAATAATTISDRTTNAINMNFVSYTNTWSNDVPVPNIGFYIANNYLQDVITEPSNLVAQYRFDSNALDSSPNNNTLTNVSSVTFNTSEYKHGTAAASFNGSNYFEIVNDGRFSPDNFTIAFWIRPKATSGLHQALASSRGTNVDGWFIYIAPNNNLEFFTGPGPTIGSWSGGSVYTNFGGVFQDIWVHIAITVNKSTGSFILYLNGSSYLSTTRIYVNNTGTNMRIGAGANESTANFIVRNGTLIDDFRFYNQVLTSSEVTAISRVVTKFAVNYGDLTSTDFSGVNFTGVNFRSTTLTGSNFTNCNFTNATLANVTVDSSTNFTGANFAGITSSGIIGTPILSAEWMMSSGEIVATLPAPTIGALATIPTKTLGTDVSFSLIDPSSNSSGAFTYESSNTSVATVSSKTVTITGAGTSTITARQASNGTYRSASVSTTLTVNELLPTFGTFTLGPKSGAYLLADVSFSLTAPTSDSSGSFSYTSDNSGVAAVIVPSSGTLYSITTPTPVYPATALTNFPILGAMPTWEMNIRFTGTAGNGNWRALIGDMYNTVNSRGWGVWISSSNGIHFSWISNTWDAPGVSVALNTDYILKLTRTPTSLTVLLTTVSSGATQTATNTAMSNTSAYVMSVNGPVTIGGWISGASNETFPGTIAYVTVINPNSSVTTNTTSNLLARYDASVAASGYTLSGSNVTQWNDLTGNGYHLIPNGTGPTATTMNSVPSLNFNSGYGLTRTSVPLSTSVTVFMAITYRSSLINEGGNFMHHGSRDTDLSIERYFNTSQIQFITDSQHPAPTIITVANNTNYILVGRLNGTSREFWRYSDTVAPVYITGSSSALVAGNKTLYVGKSDANEACNSSIGEILYYSASLSNADVNANISYLQNKWLYSRYVAWNPSTNPYVSIVSNGTANITATQVASGNYSAMSVSSLLTVGLSPTFGTFTLGPKSGAYVVADVSFSLTAPSSDSSGAFRYASDNWAVAVISSGHTVSNLLARYDASVAYGYTLSGSNVTQWNDLTGNGYNLMPNGTGPTVTSINSVPAFNFNSGYGLATSAVPKTKMVTVFIIIKYSSNIQSYGTYIQHGNRDWDWSIRNSNNTSNLVINNSGNNASPALAVVNGLNYIFIARLNNSSREIWRYSDSPTAPTNYATASGNSNFSGGGGYTNNIYVGKSEVNEASQGIIGEILYYNTALSNADVSANLLYLQNKWFNGLSSSSGVAFVGNGTANITATQDVCGNYMSKSVSSLLTVGQLPTFGTFALGPKSGAYMLTDVSFSLTAPTSDSSGSFSYTSDNSGVARVTNSVSPTLYSITNPAIPTLSLTNFPILGAMPTWEMNIRFTVTGGAGTNRSLIGDMYNSVNSSTRGWGVWVSASNGIHFSWSGPLSTGPFWDAPSVSVALNTDYILKITRGFRNINISSAINLSSPPSNMTLYNSISYVNTIFSMTVTGDATSGSIWGTDIYTSDSIIARTAVHAGVLSANETKLVYIEILSPIATYPGSTRNGITSTPFTNSALAYYSYRFITTSVATSLSLTVLLTTVSSGATQTATNTAISDTSAYVMSVNGPVTIGGFINTASENFIGTIAYVTVINPNSSVTTNTTSNLLARYDASVAASGYTLSGSNVTQWNDLTGNGYHLIPNGTGPTTTTMNSVAALNFNSGYGLLRTSVPLSTSITVFMVAKYSTAIATWGAFMHHGNRDTDWSLERNNATSSLQFQANNDNTFCQIAAANNTNYLWSGRITGNTRDFWMYSDTVAPVYVSSNTPAVTIATGNKTLYVGKSDGNEACNSSIGEIIYYNASLSNADVSANILYLQNKWLYSRYGTTSLNPYISLVSSGTANITATQDACGNYLTKSVSSLLTVYNAVTPTMGTFTVPSTKAYGDASFNISLRPTSDSSGAITYSSSNTGVATIDASGDWITLQGAGDVSFNALQAATGQFFSAAKTSNTLTVSIGTPTLSASTFSVPATKTYGDASFGIYDIYEVTYPAGVSTFGYNVLNGAPILAPNGLFSISFNEVVFPGINIDIFGVSTITLKCRLEARAPITGNWTTLQTSSGTVTYNLDNQFNQTITFANENFVHNQTTMTNAPTAYRIVLFTSSPNSSGHITQSGAGATDNSQIAYKLGGFKYDRPTSNSTGAITYSSSNPSVATIDASGNTITIVGPGDVSFNATQAAVAGQFTSATKSSNTMTILKATISLAFVNPPTTKNVTDAAFTVTATGTRPDAVTYSSSNIARATVNSSTGLVTLKGVGTVTITASQASTEFYNTSTATCSIVIASAGTTLQGQTVSSNTSFASVDLSGASLVGTTVSGVSFSSANLSNVDFSGAVITGTNFSNANISGATNLPAFSTVQKLQLLKNINNSGVGAVQFNAPISGANISSLLATPNNEVAAAIFTVKVPTGLDASANKIITVSSEDIAGNKSIYIPINENETVKLNNIVYSFNGTNLLDASGNIVTFLITQNTPFKIYAGSIVALNIQNTLNRITILGEDLYNILHEILQPKAV